MQHEDKLISFLKSIGKSIGEDLHEKLCSQDSQPRVMYDLSKIHKPLINGFPKLRPNLSALTQVLVNGQKILCLYYDISYLTSL